MNQNLLINPVAEQLNGASMHIPYTKKEEQYMSGNHDAGRSRVCEPINETNKGYRRMTSSQGRNTY